MRQDWSEMAVFLYLYWGMLCYNWKEHDKKLANRISYQIWYNRCLKEKFGGGTKSAIRGSKSTVTTALRVPFPVRCLKSTSWKVATDQITYLLQSHLQFPHKSELSRNCGSSGWISGNAVPSALDTSCLFAWYGGRPLSFFTQDQSCSRWDVHIMGCLKLK